MWRPIGGCGEADAEVTEVIASALADVVGGPIIKVVMLGSSQLSDSDENEVAAEQIAGGDEILQALMDPDRIPSDLVGKAVTHAITPIATAAFGPAGPVIAVLVGILAREITHNVLDADRNPTDVQLADSEIEMAGAAADARIGRLAGSQPFAEFISGLIGKEIAAIIDGPANAIANHKSEPVIDQSSTIKIMVAAYEVKIRTSDFGPELSDDSAPRRVRPISFGVLESIPEEAITEQRNSGSDEYLTLHDGTSVKRHINEGVPGRWAWVRD